MKIDTQTIEYFKEILDNVNETYSYSGRAMYGDKCLAVSISRDASIAGFVADVMLTFVNEYGDSREGETLVSIFERSKTDSMGLDTVLYFPTVKWNSEWDNEDE